MQLFLRPWYFVKSTGELQLAKVACTHPISDTQNKWRSSLRSNPSHWKETSVNSLPKGPCVAKCQSAHASNPNNQRMETIRRLGGRCRCNGGIVTLNSSEDSSTTISSSMVCAVV